MEDMILDYLYALTQIQEERRLTQRESNEYMTIVEFCYDNDIAIKFGIEY